jgi:hypothetical protein
MTVNQAFFGEVEVGDEAPFSFTIGRLDLPFQPTFFAKRRLS